MAAQCLSSVTLNTACLHVSSIFFPLHPVLALKHPRQEAVGHCSRVALPVLPVLAAAAVLVPKAAVGEQDAHVDDVEVRQDVLKATGQAVGQRAHQVSGVVEVACPAPESRGEQLAVVPGAIHGRVGALDVLRPPPPDPAVAVGAAEQILLVVGGPEDVITQQAQHQHPQGMSCAQLDGVVNQIQTLGSTKNNQPLTSNRASACLVYCQDNSFTTVTHNRPEGIEKSTAIVKLHKTLRRLCILEFPSLFLSPKLHFCVKQEGYKSDRRKNPRNKTQTNKKTLKKQE